MLTGTQLDSMLLYAGIGVWAMILARWAFHGNILRIDPKPDPQAIRIVWELVLIVLVFFLVASGLIREFFDTLHFRPAGSSELHDLSLQMLTDVIVKIFAGAAMIMILRRTVDAARLFNFQPIFAPDTLKRFPLWMKIVLLAIVIYLAIFPWINKLLLWIGIVLSDKVFNLPSPQGHQLFQLLNDPQTSGVIKTILILLAILISPIAEELFFRGLIQNLAYKNFRHTSSAITLTAILFTFVHVPMYHQFLSLFALGLVLGWSYYCFRSLLIPIAVHILFNSTTLILWSLGFTE
jgi:membrane protease YdiL (CAAX protease family)